MTTDRSAGFTVVDLLVAITVMGIIIGLAYRGYHGFERHFVRWQKRIALEETGRRLVTALARDLRRAEGLTKMNDNELILLFADDSQTDYGWSRSQIHRNTKPLLGPTSYEISLELTGFVISANGLHEVRTPNEMDYVAIALRLRDEAGQEFELETGVALQQQK